MKVLVVCPTYGRVPFLNRMLASFLAQDYGDKHLVIVNDDKNITLECDYENVTCINLNKQILLPQKRNLAIGLGYYDVIMQHDDDDIFLRNRISNHVKKYKENPHIWMYHNYNAYIVYGDTFKPFGASPANAASYLRSAWYAVRGYENLENFAEDLEFFEKMPNKLIENDVEDYVYNWGGVNYHTSCLVGESIQERAYKQLEEMNLLGKTYKIQPDFIMLNKFYRLHDEWVETKKEQKVIHTELGQFKLCLTQ